MASPPESYPVAGIILAAGESKRLGRPKQLLDIGGEPLVRRVTRTALQSRLSPIIVIVGHAGDLVSACLDDLGVDIALNAQYATGQASSLVTGIARVPESSPGAVILLGDQPTMSAQTVDAVIDLFDSGDDSIVQARYRGQPGHPVLFARSLFAALTRIDGDKGAREIITRNRKLIRYVDVDQDSPPDIDSELDFQRVQELLREDQAK